MATVTFTAQVPGTEDAPITRTTGTMPYVAYAGGTWHRSFAAAYKAAQDRYHAPGTVVYPVVPTAINGKLGEWAPHVNGWGDIPASAFQDLVAAKAAAKAKDATKRTAKAEASAEDQAVRNSAAAYTTAAGVHHVRRGGSLGQPLQFLAKDGKAAEFSTLRAAQQAVQVLSAVDQWLDAEAPAAQDAPVHLVWEPRTPKLGHTARGAKHVYRTVRRDTGAWYAEQRGLNGGWTPVGGKCPGQAQAQELAQRYENGERKLSHKAYRTTPYAQLPAQV